MPSMFVYMMKSLQTSTVRTLYKYILYIYMVLANPAHTHRRVWRKLRDMILKDNVTRDQAPGNELTHTQLLHARTHTRTHAHTHTHRRGWQALTLAPCVCATASPYPWCSKTPASIPSATLSRSGTHRCVLCVCVCVCVCARVCVCVCVCVRACV